MRIGGTWSLALAAVVSLTFGPDVSGQVIAQESFNYPAGSPLSLQNGGTGWSGGWQGFSGDVTAGSLTDPSGTLASSGNSVTSAQGLGSGRNLAAAVGTPGTTVYLGFLERRLGSPSSSDVGSVHLSGSATINLGALAGDRWGIDWELGPPTFDSRLASSTLPVGTQTALLVGRVDFALSGDAIRLYVNPTPGAPEPATAAASVTVPHAGTFNSIGFFNSGNNYAYDELRLGPTFESVTPVPEPSGFVLVGGALVGGWAVRRRRAGIQLPPAPAVG